MRQLGATELNAISGCGAGPEMILSILGQACIFLSVGAAGVFVMGMGAVLSYQYLLK
jgi:hypothetical protein